MARLPITSPDSPAAPSREDEVLIREIDEAVREDALLEFLRKHGVKVLGGVLALVAALGGYMIWHHFSEAELERHSETVIAALDLADKEDFKSASDKVAGLLGDDSSPGARAAARFIQAAAALEGGDRAKASGLYKQIAADPTTPAALRDLARLREVSINYDMMKPADVIAQLGSLAKPGNPYFGSAGELVAMAHLEAGNRAEAGKLFSEMSKDEDLPETLRSRARQMAGLMGVDAIVDVKKLLKDEGVTSESDGADAPAAQPAPAAQ
ncbi:tetratricopeptide repeat protein [Porphyrobacter sp. AAP82]|uniref:tetratricopeptide repeat protein n=1 Tax=Porphyrobacter sp. AAP82 TaxID=1248917 RepID=UPI00030BE4F2|nr:tetratricopeptide repeat protein [Porphyrobacter sp. AAP82]